MLISIVVPTIDGREDYLERCLTAYAAHGGELEFVVVRNEKTCGRGWQRGAERAHGDYIHLTCDDIEPCAGWWEGAVRTIERGFVPAPRVLNTDGSLQTCGDVDESPDGARTDFTRLPFVSRAQWEVVQPMIPLHYFTDNWVSDRCRAAGIETVVARDYLVLHHLAQEGRGAGMGTENARMTHDRLAYTWYVSGAVSPDVEVSIPLGERPTPGPTV